MLVVIVDFRYVCMLKIGRVWIVRESLLEKVRRKWNLESAEIIHVEDDNNFAKLETLLKKGINI